MSNNRGTTSGDLEVGAAVAGTVTSNSLKNSAACGGSGRVTVNELNNSRKKGYWQKILRIFQCFNLARKTALPMALLILCVAAAIVDPLFFYIPMISVGEKCMKPDRKLGIVAMTLRTLVDVLHLVLWWFYYQKKWKAMGTSEPHASSTAAPAAATKETPPGNTSGLSPRVSMVTGLLIMMLCILPLPQSATAAILIIKGSPRSQTAILMLKFSVLGQSILRAFRVFPSFHEATGASTSLYKIRFWLGPVFNLLLFVIASHLVGAFWYLLSVGRTMDCWKSACRSRVGCNIDSLFCGGLTGNRGYLDDYCPFRQVTNSSAFDFGIYLSALEPNIVGSTVFPLKLSYCFWWGLRSLSSLGQNLTTSAYVWEICFSICISIVGLILFSLFIGNMQAYFQYQTNGDLRKWEERMKKAEEKKRDLRKWKLFDWLQPELREDIILCINDSWLKTTEVNLEAALDHLPEDLGRKIRKSVFSEMQKKVKLLTLLEEQAPESMIDCLKPRVFPEGRPIVKEGLPIDKVVFILQGKLTKQTVEDEIKDPEPLELDFCGEELLKWIISPESENRPRGAANFKAFSEVEAFIIEEKDLRFLADKSPDDKTKIKNCISESKMMRSVENQKRKEKAADRPAEIAKSASFKESQNTSDTP